jgi:hypothetical protein
MANACWLETPSGLRVPVGPGGVLIGRASDCELVVADPRASRRHALLRLSAEGPELVPFGSNPTLIDDREVSAPTALVGGERLRIADLVCTVVVGAGLAPADTWLLATATGERVPLPRGRTTAGGALSDALILPGLPPACATFDVSDDAVRLVTDGGEGRVLVAGDVFHLRDQTLTLHSVVPGTEDTTRMAGQGLPRRARLTFLPRGGRLFLQGGAAPVELYLSERRCALVATLLQPPAGFAVGEFIPDERVIPRVWRNSGDRHALNVLVARTRKDLSGVGFNGFALIERAPAGGATRFALAEGGVAEVL